MSTSANAKPASPAWCSTKFWRCLRDARERTNSASALSHSHGTHFMTEETTPAPRPSAAPPADPPTAPNAAPPRTHSEAKRATLALVAAVAAWLLPGLGHALLKMWGRALAIFFSVG